MDAKNTVRDMERNAMAMFAPWNEAMNQSRVYFEKSVAAMRGETMDLLNRLHDLNGEVLAHCENRTDFAGLAAAQEKWFTDFSRDMYQRSLRLHETTRHMLADGIESVGQSMRNGAQAAAEAGEHAAAAMSGATHDAANAADSTLRHGAEALADDHHTA